MGVEIRLYTQEDYQQTKKILTEGSLFYDPMDSQERLTKKIKRDPESILVAEENSQIVGTVSFMEDGRMPFIFRLAIDTSHRKQGLGKALMERAKEILRLRGYNEINILVDERDEELQDYYRKQGYEKGNTYRWMSKELK